MGERGPRRMPSMKKICEHWRVPFGYCFRCGQPARCDRAHIIDRCFDGLDDVQNIVPLCYPCHSDMPPFWPGDERAAYGWLVEDYWPWRAWEATRRHQAQLLGLMQYLDAMGAPFMAAGPMNVMHFGIRREATNHFPIPSPDTLRPTWMDEQSEVAA